MASSKINRSLTDRIIDLHQKGYVLDFHLLGDLHYLCAQDNVCIAASSVEIRVVDQVYDKLFNAFKYIHTVESECGYKGMLIADEIVTLRLSH